MAAAVSCALLGAMRCCGGTTTVGDRWSRAIFVASWELRRRSALEGRGTTRDPADMTVAIEQIVREEADKMVPVLS